MKATVKFFNCKVCGNMVGLIKDGSGELTCCGQPMLELIPNTVRENSSFTLRISGSGALLSGVLSQAGQ